jgi:hypothetical protein
VGRANVTARNVAQGLYQKPPQLAEHGVEDDPAGVVEDRTRYSLDRHVRIRKNLEPMPPKPDTVWRSLKA